MHINPSRTNKQTFVSCREGILWFPRGLMEQPASHQRGKQLARQPPPRPGALGDDLRNRAAPLPCPQVTSNLRSRACCTSARRSQPQGQNQFELVPAKILTPGTWNNSSDRSTPSMENSITYVVFSISHYCASRGLWIPQKNPVRALHCRFPTFIS